MFCKNNAGIGWAVIEMRRQIYWWAAHQKTLKTNHSSVSLATKSKYFFLGKLLAVSSKLPMNLPSNQTFTSRFMFLY